MDVALKIWRFDPTSGERVLQDYEVDAPIYNYVREVDYVTGALIATPRSVFEKLNGLDERYRPIYYEETDYCFRLREAAYSQVRPLKMPRRTCNAM